MGCAQISSASTPAQDQVPSGQARPTLLKVPVTRPLGESSNLKSHPCVTTQASLAWTHAVRQAEETQQAKNNTPLHIASSNGDEEAVRTLLESGANINACNAYNETALHCAATFGHLAVAHVLISTGAKVDAMDLQEMTPLHAAASMSRVDVALALLNAGASLKAKSVHGYTPFAMAQDWGSCHIACVLAEKGGDR